MMQNFGMIKQLKKGGKMRLTNDQAKENCKVGQGEVCCIFLTMGVKGWECAKSDKAVKDTLTKKWLAGTTNAKGTGRGDDCPFKLLNESKTK